MPGSKAAGSRCSRFPPRTRTPRSSASRCFPRRYAARAPCCTSTPTTPRAASRGRTRSTWMSPSGSDRVAAAGAPDALKEASLALTGGRFVDAETICRAALVRHPRHARLRAALGAALRRQRRTDEAEVEFREVARLWPRSPAAHLDLGVVL